MKQEIKLYLFVGYHYGKSDKAISFIYSCMIAEISRNNLRPKFSFHGQDKCQFEEYEKNCLWFVCKQRTVKNFNQLFLENALTKNV